MNIILNENITYDLNSIGKLVNSNGDKFMLIEEYSCGGGDYDGNGASFIYFNDFISLKNHLLKCMEDDNDEIDFTKKYKEYLQDNNIIACSYGDRYSSCYYKIPYLSKEQFNEIRNEYKKK